MTQHDVTSSSPNPGGAGSTADHMRRESSSVADEARGAARDASAEARRTADQLKGGAAGLAGTVRNQISGQVEAQKDGIAERISAVAHHLHGTAGELRGREGWLADLMERGASELDGFADELKQRDVRGLFGSVESLAHRHPALFIGSAVAIGFALTRMVRGGMDDDYSYGRGRTAGPGYVASDFSGSRPGQGTYGSVGGNLDPIRGGGSSSHDRPELKQTASQMGSTSTTPSSGVGTSPLHERPDLKHTADQMGNGQGASGIQSGPSPDLKGSAAGGVTKGSNI